MDPWGSSAPTGPVTWCLGFCFIRPSTWTPISEGHHGQNAASKSFSRKNDVLLIGTLLYLKEIQLFKPK